MMSFLKNVKKRNYVLCGDYCEKQTIFLVQINVYAFRPNNISVCVFHLHIAKIIISLNSEYFL